MLDIAYCGYAYILIVLMFVVVRILLFLLRILIIIFLSNYGMFLISFKIFNVGFFGDFEFLFRIWRFLFLILVIIIRTRVIIFSLSYMSGLIVTNFVLLYLGFIIRIVWLILNNNFYRIIFGWDGSGVVSFLLIVFYSNYESINNGLFTLFQNRVGDLFFVFFILGIIDMVILRNVVLKWGILFLVIGACVKSAQFPFNSWLLAAIRAPTPISSLVHSSTLVVAGVYILLEFSYCLIDVLEILKFIRVLSLIIRRFGLINELDIKKLIAYSTISHVSLIIYLLRFKIYKIVYFHLNIHAIFKPLIFMCFGFVILSSFHSQDKRLVSLVNVNPLIKILYYFSCLCLAGLPFLRGFFSKDFIIEKFIEFRTELLWIILLLLFLRISIYYRIKLLSLVNYIFSYRIIEKRFLGVFSVVFMISIIILLINVYISLVIRLSLEILSFKIRIYFLTVIFFLLRIMTNLNYKLNLYDKMSNFKEVWRVNCYILDKFVFWNVFSIIEYVGSLRNVKLIVLINWWILILFIRVF